MTKELSSKIKFISLICTVMVVYRHAHTLEAFFGADCTTCYTHKFVAKGITNMTSIAVPYFFLISGFFFFKHSYYNKRNYISMLKKKFVTLFIPFCIWNMLAIYPLWFSGKIVIEEHWLLYIIDFLHSDYNGPLWYVRTLMIFMLLSPLVDWIFCIDAKFGRNVEFLIQLAFIAYIFFIWWPMDTKALSTEGALFFLLGGIIRKHGEVLDKQMNIVLAWCLYIVWLASCFFVSLDYWTSKIHLLFGVFLFWNTIRIGCKEWCASMAGYTFFIYVNHFIFLKVIKTLIASYFYRNEAIALATFLFSPILVVFLIWKMGLIWNKLSPKTFTWVTGGRT